MLTNKNLCLLPPLKVTQVSGQHNSIFYSCSKCDYLNSSPALIRLLWNCSSSFLIISMKRLSESKLISWCYDRSHNICGQCSFYILAPVPELFVYALYNIKTPATAVSLFFLLTCHVQLTGCEFPAHPQARVLQTSTSFLHLTAIPEAYVLPCAAVQPAYIYHNIKLCIAVCIHHFVNFSLRTKFLPPSVRLPVEQISSWSE